MRFKDDGTGMGRLTLPNGSTVYTGRHIPTSKNFIGWRRWPPLVAFRDTMFIDTGATDDQGFRLYEKVPKIAEYGEGE